MPFHHKHLPTFSALYRTLRQGYSGLRRSMRFAVDFVVAIVLLGILYWLFLSAPPGFPAGAYVRVAQGDTLEEVAQKLEDRAVVRSAWLFELFARTLGDDRHIPAGEYYFPRAEGLLSVAVRVVSGDFNTTPVRITVQEGATNKEIVEILAERLPGFDIREFKAAVRDKEGYLFPDTYFFMPGESTDAILSVFNNGLQSRLQRVRKELDASGKPLSEILTMASILEKEASKLEDRKLISGVLWHRIKIGMPLQVDAVFPYYLGRNTFEVTIDDLKQDHPYNTYVNKGLPPGPIGNPGYEAIQAALMPTASKYIFFLSDRQGNFHFATTYAQHLANKARYLD